MNTPSPNYVAMLNASLPQPAASQAPLPEPAPVAPPFGSFSGAPVPSPELPPAGPPAPPPTGPLMSVMPPAGPSMTPGPAPPPRGPGPSQPFLQRIASGVAPAKSTELRGPELRGAQEHRNAAFEGAVQAVTERSQQTAAGDFAVALEQQRKAQIHEDAANYSVAERGAEMEQRQMDFDQSVKALSKQSMDPDRYWANASVGRKIAIMLSAGAAGFVQGRTGHGGGNIGIDTAMKLADADLKAQEFGYNAARDTVNAKQTAFSMAMQKYNNADAARAAARASMMETLQAQLGQQAALWKGTDAANRAQMAIASLQDEKMQQIAQGIMFTPAHATAGGFVDPRTGITYSNKEAQGVVKDMDERHAKSDEQDKGIAGQLLVEHAKEGSKKDDKIDTETRAISSQLQQAGVPLARANAELALRALNKSEGGRGEAALRAMLPGTADRAVMGDDANAREDAYNDFVNAAIKATAGNATASEEVRVVRSMGSTGDPKARVRAIGRVLNALAEVEKGAKAGASPEAQAEYDRRRDLAKGAPDAAPEGASAGWK